MSFKKTGDAEVSGDVVEVKEIKKDKKKEEESTRNIRPKEKPVKK